jgi:cell division protein FtsN
MTLNTNTRTRTRTRSRICARMRVHSPLQSSMLMGTTKRAQRGGFAMGLVAGMLIGLALALGVALFITKAPVPFVNKVPQRTADQDTAETERNRTWDPNAPLSGKGQAGKPGAPAAVGAGAGGGVAGAPPATAYPDVVPGQPPVPVTVTGQASAPVAKPNAAPARDPAAILSGAATPPPSPAPTAAPTAAPATNTGNAAATGPDPFIYFVQAGAFARNEDAEQQRAKLGLLGQQAKITEREQSGRVMYRVRMGPYPRRDDADSLQARLQEQAIESQIVRVEKP